MAHRLTPDPVKEGAALTSPTECPSCARANEAQANLCAGCGAPLVRLKRGVVVADRYELLEQIGKGGMGHVFRAHDRVLADVVALKILLPELSSSEEMVARFRNEAQLAQSIAHPNVASIHECGVHAGFEYISMELVEGVNLRKHLRRRGRGLERSQAFGAVISLAAGLQAIHEAGILHRDLKTENIIIDREGRVRLLDFGIAKGLVQRAGTPLTRVGMILGTPQYMSPEQCQAHPLDERSDVYSLGIVCHEIFTGTVPFDDVSPMATMMLHIKEPPPLERAHSWGLPRSLVAPLRRALAKDPKRRFPSALEFKRALEKARLESRTETSDRVAVVTEPERRQNKRVAVEIDCWLRVVDGQGATVQEELTVADDIGGGGARVRTKLSGLDVGQRIVFEEAGRAFRSNAEIRGLSSRTLPGEATPTQRVHLLFLDDHLRPLARLKRTKKIVPPRR